MRAFFCLIVAANRGRRNVPQGKGTRMVEGNPHRVPDHAADPGNPAGKKRMGTGTPRKEGGRKRLAVALEWNGEKEDGHAGGAAWGAEGGQGQPRAGAAEDTLSPAFGPLCR